MKTSKLQILAYVFALSAAFHSVPSRAYGGGGSSSACQEPQFFTESPANLSAVPSLGDFRFTASETDASTLNVKVNGVPVAATTAPIPNGDLKVSIHLAEPITTPGKVQILVDAKSKDGCSGFKPYYIEVRP